MPTEDVPSSADDDHDDCQGSSDDSCGAVWPFLLSNVKDVAEELMAIDPDSCNELLFWGDKCLRRLQYDLAEFLVTQSIRIAETQQRDSSWLCSAYLLLSEVLQAEGRYLESLTWAERAYRLADEVPLSVTQAAAAAAVIERGLRPLGRDEEATIWREILRKITESFGSQHQ